MCWIGGYDPYGNEGGEANKKKGQYTFSDQLGFILLNIEVKSEEKRGVVQPKPYAKAEPPKAKKDTHTNGKGKSESQPTRDRDIKFFKLHLSVQTEELCLQETMGRLNLKVKRFHLW